MSQVTFYGHFAGWSSYPVVCREIAQWLVRQGVDLQVVNLRGEPCDLPSCIPRAPQALHIEVRNAALQYSKSREDSQLRRRGVALVFGFPEWLRAVPRYEHVVGYHVCDYANGVSPRWVADMERADAILTPSAHCRDAFFDAGLDRAVGVVQHGVGAAFSPRAHPWTKLRSSVNFRHFRSAVNSDRKGTDAVLASKHGVPIDMGGPSRRPSVMALLYKTIDCLVAPSRAEGFGMMPLEALACGTPVVATTSTGHAEWADTIDGGLVRVADDLSDLDSALDFYRANEEELHRKAENFAPSVRDHWSWDAALSRSPLLSALR